MICFYRSFRSFALSFCSLFLCFIMSWKCMNCRCVVKGCSRSLYVSNMLGDNLETCWGPLRARFSLLFKIWCKSFCPLCTATVVALTFSIASLFFCLLLAFSSSQAYILVSSFFSRLCERWSIFKALNLSSFVWVTIWFCYTILQRFLH